jgi:hypothetical protein
MVYAARLSGCGEHFRLGSRSGCDGGCRVRVRGAGLPPQFDQHVVWWQAGVMPEQVISGGSMHLRGTSQGGLRSDVALWLVLMLF